LGETAPIEIARAARAIVAETVATAGFEPPTGLLDRIETFAAALALWGARLNLTAAPDNPGEIAFHIIDSLAPLILAIRDEVPPPTARAGSTDALVAKSTVMPTARAGLADAFVSGSRVLDLGSGAGFPALILAAACDADFLLMEARRKRASFLRVTAAEMGLSNVQVDSARADPAALRRVCLETSHTETRTSRPVGAESSRASAADMRTARLQTLTPRTNTTAAQEVRADSSPGQAEASLGDRVGSSRAATVALPKIQVGSSRRTTGALRGVFDVVTARAFAEPAIVFETAAAALKDGGRVILYASAAQREAIERASAAMFEPPVFLPYSLTHASSGTFAGGATRIGSISDASGSTVSLVRAATGTFGIRSTVEIIGAATGTFGDSSIGGLSGGSTGNVADGSKGGVIHMLAVCRRR
jgi:16S rRNA G527 N7-methylase RsmG